MGIAAKVCHFYVIYIYISLRFSAFSTLEIKIQKKGCGRPRTMFLVTEDGGTLILDMKN